MAIRLSKPQPPKPDPPLFVAALHACVGRDPGFLRGERVAGAGPFASLLPQWSALDDVLVEAVERGAAA